MIGKLFMKISNLELLDKPYIHSGWVRKCPKTCLRSVMNGMVPYSKSDNLQLLLPRERGQRTFQPGIQGLHTCISINTQKVEPYF